jgi:hypothetical protein
MMTDAQWSLAPSVIAAQESFRPDELIGAARFVRGVLAVYGHRFANGRFSSLQLEDTPREQTAQEWLDQVQMLFDPVRIQELTRSDRPAEMHGRLLIIGLSLLEPELRRQLEDGLAFFALVDELAYPLDEVLTERGLTLERGDRHLGLEAAPKGFAFLDKTDPRWVVGDVYRASGELRVGAVAEEPEPRWLQGQLYEIDEGREIRLDRALRAGALHRLAVRIGAADEDWITAPEDAAVPIEELPEDQEGYELRIVFSEPHHVPQPLADTIYLPRLRGNSTTCEFQFRTRRDVEAFEGRVVVMYGTRILQTMFLVAQVLPEPVHAPPDAAIELKPETAVRAHLAGLDSREPFDVALVADTGSDGAMHVAGFTAERVELRSLENVEQPIKRMRRRLSQIASSPEDFRDLDAEATQNLLRFLARQGSLLYDGIVRTQVGERGLLSDQDRRIQLVSARESFLPLEFMYDHPSPLPEARLCPGAREALQTGQCTHCDQLDEEAKRAYVCPLGFWCMSRVIERHAVKPVAETNLSGTEYALQSDPIAGRDTLDVLNGAVYAASNRVQEAQIEELLETLADVTDHRVEHVPDWGTWRAAVESRNPSILVLLPHTLEDADAIPALEIGEQHQLPEDQITASYVHTARDYHPPVVLLLGCETAQPDVPFQAFAVQFRIHGAAIVLSTLTPVLGRHAVPVAQMLLGELKQAARASGTFGDALLGLRRRALAAGIPMVLSLVAYGDADWRLYSGATAAVSVDVP